MKSRILIFTLALLTLSNVAFSEALAIAKLGYYRPTSNVLRNIYSNSWLSVGGEASGNFSETQPVLKRTYLVGKVNYTENRGHSIGLRDRTHIHIVPLSLGPRILESFTNVAVPFDLFIGGGANYTFVNVKNDSTVAKSKVHESGWGGYGELGTFIRPKEHFIIALIASYSYSPISPPGDSKACDTHRVDVGGLLIEGGLGYKF